jgi:nucleoside-diphosphate-sugar epimerase
MPPVVTLSRFFGLCEDPPRRGCRALSPHHGHRRLTRQTASDPPSASLWRIAHGINSFPIYGTRILFFCGTIDLSRKLPCNSNSGRTLSHLVKCNVEQRCYTVFGYRGKQVRDNIHSLDVAKFIARIIEAPRRAAVYNIGGGKANSCSVLEAFALVADRTGTPMNWTYDERAREGDHICYYSDLRQMMADYPSWEPRISLGETIDQIVAATEHRVNGA